MAEMDSETRREIIGVLQAGQKIQAIKLYRESTGSDLRTAKDFIETLQTALATGEVPPAPGIQSESAATDEIVRLLRDGKKLAAIKLHREATGVGLKEAKLAVEAIAAERGIESQRAGCSVTAAALVLIACLIWWL